MAASPSFTSTPRIGSVTVSTANTNLDGTGTIVSVLTGVAAGTKVFEVRVQAQGTTSDGAVRLFLSTDGGSTWRLFEEFSVPLTTVSASSRAVQGSRSYDNLVLPNASCQLGASTHNAESFSVFAFGGDLT
jgi:hypothetical protein